MADNSAMIEATAACVNEMLDGIDKTLPELSVEALNWRPGSETNSIYSLTAHLLGAVEAWAAMAADKKVDRDRPAEFVAEGPSAQKLLAKSQSVRKNVSSFLGELKSADLGKLANNPYFEGKTAAWCIGHALAHMSEHYGQLLLTKQMWDQKQA